jgi:protein involved in polysaccharide export with SLBB domain
MSKIAAVIIVILMCAGCRHTAPPHSEVKFNHVQSAPGSTPPGTPLHGVTVTNTIDPAWLQPPADLFTLGPGDKLDIEFMGETNSLTTTIVGPDGKVYFNLLPGIDVWGLTLAQAKAQFEKELSKYVKEQPQVTLVLRGIESKQVWVLGRVTAPGVYPLTAPMTLLEAISTAGGTMSLTTFRDQEAAGIGEELADMKRSFIVRQGRMLPVDFQRLIQRGDMSQNIYLQPDDFVYLPSATAREVYVLGAVAQPRAVAYHANLTVVAAVAGAFGTINGAYLTHVAVVRGSLSQPEIAVMNYKKIIRGEATDIVLQPGDIVYVPFSPYRYLYKYAQLILDTFASSLAINAGERAVGRGPNGGAVVTIPVTTTIQTTTPTVVVPATGSR